jgi:hypothetical protein
LVRSLLLAIVDSDSTFSLFRVRSGLSLHKFRSAVDGGLMTRKEMGEQKAQTAASE